MTHGMMSIGSIRRRVKRLRIEVSAGVGSQWKQWGVERGVNQKTRERVDGREAVKAKGGKVGKETVPWESLLAAIRYHDWSRTGT